MNNYNVVLTESEKLAMQYICVDIQEWINNFVHVRAESAIDDIVQKAIPKYFAENINIPNNKEQIIIDAFEKGWVKLLTNTNNNQI